MVVCTHPGENMDKQLKTVTETFWPGGVLDTNRAIPCSLMGLSARHLLAISKTTKPPFEVIWNKRSLGHHVCVPLFSMVYAE